MSKIVLLNKKQLAAGMKSLPDWRCNATSSRLYKTFTQPDYVTGLVFIARIAVHAEIEQHHPDIQFTYGKVKVTLYTHEVKGLTAADIKLANTIEKLSTK